MDRSRASGGAPGWRRGVMMGSHALCLLQEAPYVTGHYVCHVCWERASGPLYHCADCQLDVHTKCVGVGSAQQAHFSHFQHPLLFKSVSGAAAEVVCDGCGDACNLSSSHSSYVYQCSGCNFDLCPLCVRAPRYLLHISHPHVLVLSPLDELSSSCECDGCGQAARGLMYRCSSCNFDLHQSCVRLPLKPIHAKHPEHPLTLLFRDEDKRTSYTCNACGQAGRGWAYNCSICRLNLHPSCGKIHHELPRNSSHGGQGQFKPKVANRHANLQTGFWPARDLIDRHRPQALLGSPSTRGGNSAYHDRSYASSLEPISPYPYSSRSNFLGGSHNFLGGSQHDYRSFNTSPSHDHSNYGEFRNGKNASSNAILAQALGSRLTPRSPRDADAVDRVMGMLRQTYI